MASRASRCDFSSSPFKRTNRDRMSIHSFYGLWQLHTPNQSATTWHPGHLLIYCLGDYHWRMTLRKKSDPSFCQDFILSSTAHRITQGRVGSMPTFQLNDGTTLKIEGLSAPELRQISGLLYAITTQIDCRSGRGSSNEVAGLTKKQCTDDKDTYRYHDNEHGGACLNGFHEMSKNEQLTDITLVAQGEEFRSHRALLAANSTYFNAMLCGQFVESQKEKIELSEIDGKCMRDVLHFLYTGDVELTVETVQPLFNAAHFLQLMNLEKACVGFMHKQMTKSNCIGVYFFAKSFNKEELQEQAKELICMHFKEVTKMAEFLHLEGKEASQIIGIDFMLPYTEQDVCDAALRWLEFDMPARQEHMFTVMKYVRFALLDESFFREHIKFHAMFQGCRELQVLFEQIIYYMSHPYRWHEIDLIQESRWRGMRRELPSRAIMYTAQEPNGKSSLQMYSPQQNTCALNFELDQMTHSATLYLYSPALTTCHAPSREVCIAGGSQSSSKLAMCLNIPQPRRSQSPNVSWRPLENLKHSRQLFSFVSVDDCLYAVGGCHKGVFLDSVEKCSLRKSHSTNNQWVNVASLPCRLRAHCAISFRGKLYVFGGDSKPKQKSRKIHFSPNVFCYDPEVDRWSTLSPMKEGRALAGCAMYRGSIYVIGGINSTVSDAMSRGENPEGGEVSTCELYDPLTDQWTEGPALPGPLAAPGVVKYNGTIYVMGGIVGGKACRSVYHLNEAGDSWCPVKQDLYHPATVTTDFRSSYLPVDVLHNRERMEDTSSSDTDGTEVEVDSSRLRFLEDSSTEDTDSGSERAGPSRQLIYRTSSSDSDSEDAF